MASVGLLALIDDIATLLDDVALLTKVSAKKTAGLLGDDLALNAQQVTGVRAERELPIVWAVAKGSAKNKLVLVPVALLLSAFIPWLITPLLMMGGIYLCFEGFEKIAEKIWHSEEFKEHAEILMKGMADPDFDLLAFEKDKIKGAIRTDFILSAEIVVIALGVVQAAPFMQQVVVVSLIAAVVTIGVYGVVAAIVKLDDAGLYLLNSKRGGLIGKVFRHVGRGVLLSCPYLMKTLSIVGTAAMFLVGGGIMVHSIPSLHVVSHFLIELPFVVALPEAVFSSLFNAVLGVLIGMLFVAIFSLIKKFVLGGSSQNQ